MEDFSVPLSLLKGSNTLTLQYVSLGSPDAGFQGLGDEGWGFSNLVVSSVPEPGTWALMLVGLAGLGYALRRTRLHGAPA
jgi:PEP-CTERM motif